MYDKFYCKLPEFYEEFVNEFIKHFPSVYDSKLVVSSSSIILKQTNLTSNLFETYQSLEKINSINFKNGKEDKEEVKEKMIAHDALHDSIMTGKIFLKSLNILSIVKYKIKKLINTYKEILDTINDKSEFEKRTCFFKNRV